MASTDLYEEDPRNATVHVWMNGHLVPRAQAMVSVLDSGFLRGDGVWEGLAVHHGRVPFLDAHLDRLFENARALDLDLGIDRAGIRVAIDATLLANGMMDGAHIRLMFTRGLRSTPIRITPVASGGATQIVLAEFKQPASSIYAKGITLATVHVRCGRPDVQDPAWNVHSQMGSVVASIAADKVGADEGLMLDPHGFVASCNSTHFFVVRRGELWTSSGRYCRRGVTRGVVLEIAGLAGIRTRQTDFSLTQVYGADEAFCTGTYPGILPVRSIDGRDYSLPGPITTRLRELFADRIEAECSG